MTKDKMTDRVLNAVQNKYVKVLAHPTTRKLLERDPVKVDLDKVFDAAIENNVAIEINSQPKRLDLDFVHVKEGKEKGVKFVVNTDSHSTEQLNNMRYGVIVARRGWLEKKDVVNCMSLSKIVKFFKLKE